jgi:cytochrome P450
MKTRATAVEVRSPSLEGAPCGNFNFAAMAPGGLKGKIASWLFDDPQWWMGLLRRFWPIARLPGGWAVVTRFEHVQEVLAKESVFQVPFGERMMEMTSGPNFVLGMQDGPEYQRQHAQILQAFRRDDVAAIVAPLSAKFAGEIVGACDGRIDAIEDLITRVPTLLCESYYGVPIADKRLFAQWTIAMSGYMFGPPGKRPENAGTAVAAANCIRPVIDDAIRNAKAATNRTDTILARFVAMQREGAEGLTDEVIRGHLFGMITGFVPTNTIAAGNVLEMLLRRPDFMARARAAALADDDELLRRCLFEAMRFKPINPGPFRVCREDYTIGKGTGGATTIRAGTRMMVSTQSAMFDERKVHKPAEFNPDRASSDYLLFGHGLHWCIGAYIAGAQITQTFKPLLKRGGLRRSAGDAGRMHRLSVFPVHLSVEFDA